MEEQFTPILPVTGNEITFGDITVDNVPIEDFGPPQPVTIGDFTVDNTASELEVSAFGVSINEHDDFTSIGLVLAIVLIGYVGKVTIDYWFACKLERYKKKLNS